MRGQENDTVTISPERQSEFTGVLNSTLTWARSRSDILALGLAGSWARHEARMSSDMDFVVLTVDTDAYVAHCGWIPSAAGQSGHLVRTRSWGPLTERRIELRSGLHVEYGFAPVTWARIDPVDAGTARVVTDGFRVLYDPEGVLARLVATVHR
jgi:hypothetical protein